MYRMVNLPAKKDNQIIEGKFTGHSYRIQTSDGWEICQISKSTDEGIAREIAAAIRFARDLGYAQAQEDMRRQLGLK